MFGRGNLNEKSSFFLEFKLLCGEIFCLCRVFKKEFEILIFLSGFDQLKIVKFEIPLKIKIQDSHFCPSLGYPSLFRTPLSHWLIHTRFSVHFISPRSRACFFNFYFVLCFIDFDFIMLFDFASICFSILISLVKFLLTGLIRNVVDFHFRVKQIFGEREM